MEDGKFIISKFVGKGTTHPYENGNVYENGISSSDLFLSNREIEDSVDFTIAKRVVEINNSIQNNLDELRNNNYTFSDNPNYEKDNFVDRMTYISRRVEQNFIKNANEMDPARRTADSLYKIIEFAFYRVPPSERKRFLSRLRGKVIKVNPTELSIKQNKPDSAINQSITFAKGLLSGLSPAFIQRVLAELTNKINVGIMGDKMAQEKVVLSKRAIKKTAKPKEKHTGAMLALMAPKSVIKQLKCIVDEDSISSDGLHLTLLYLGKAKDLNKNTIKAIENAVAKVCERHEPLKMIISGWRQV
jgi:hypothetical protein